VSGHVKEVFDELLTKFVAAAQAVYGGRLVSIAFYGSVAKGTMGHDSDVKLLVVVCISRFFVSVENVWGFNDQNGFLSSSLVVREMACPAKRKMDLKGHYHLAGHWIVLKGTAQTICGDKTILFTEKLST